MNSKGVTATDHLTEMSAKTFGGVFEEVKDESCFDRMIILAPHGGDIEPGTSDQAKTMYYDLFNRNCQVTLWVLNGYMPGGGAFRRFHVPSSEFEVEDFPKLGALLSRNYAYSFAFHGCKGSTAFVGGTADDGLKNEVACAINAVHGDIAIEVISSGPYGGVSPNNIVNKLSKQSVQIELPRALREGVTSLAIAYALADLFAGRLR